MGVCGELHVTRARDVAPEVAAVGHWVGAVPPCVEDQRRDRDVGEQGAQVEADDAFHQVQGSC